MQKCSGKGASISAGALLGEPRGGSFPGDLEEYGEGSSWARISLCGGLAGEPGRGLSTEDLCVEEGSGDRHLSLYMDPVENNGGGRSVHREL